MRELLIADRDRAWVGELRPVLEADGWTCRIAASQDEALEKAAQHPDLIVLDLALETPTAGCAVVNRLRDPYGDTALAAIPIAAVTGIDASTGLGFHKVAGTPLLPVDAYLSKPAAPVEVAAAVRRLVAADQSTPREDGAPGTPEGGLVILCLNCGSSSVKYRLYDWGRKETLATGIVERVGESGSVCIHETAGGVREEIAKDCPSHGEAIKLVIDTLVHPACGVIRSLDQITAVGHRMVHGGERFAKSVEITDEAMAVFRELVDLAPLHNPPNILGVETGRALLPAVKHIAVMDTAWHQTMPDYAWLYALPYEWYERYGVRRYGFHGTSLLYVSRRAAVLLNRDPFACNLVLAHIGNGVSCNAVRLGVSCDTSMGLTPLEGLVMGTRAGDHDPAIDLYIMEKQGLSPAEMRALLNKKSGLLGITGSYIDRRDVMAGMARGEERARLAFEIETYRLRKYIGAYAAAMGRTDAIVFTAGVGEMGAEVRAKALEGLACMGVKLDPELNRLARSRNAEMEISTPDSDVKVYVIPTDEERVFIEDVVSFFERAPSGKARFTYRFQSPRYRNRLRDDAFAGECRKNPELRKAAALITEGCLR